MITHLFFRYQVVKITVIIYKIVSKTNNDHIDKINTFMQDDKFTIQFHQEY